MNAAKLKSLTTSQEERLVEFREEWRAIGLSCEPADFKTGDEIITSFYARLGKPAPIIMHFSSPAMCELAVNFVFGVLKEPKAIYSQLGSQLRSQLGSQLHSQLHSQLYSQLHSQLDSQLYSQLHSQLYSQLDSQLDSQLYSQLHSQLDSQLRSQLHSQLYSQLHSQLYSQLHSQLYSQLGSQLRSQLGNLKSYFLSNRWGSGHWCAWEAFYLFGHEIGVKYKAEDIALLLEWGRLSQSIGWWAPWDGICFVSDRPREVHFDVERRLHNETGMAVRYSDGWGCFAWRGTSIPGEWITDRKALDAKTAITWANLEQRRIACSDIVGWAKILKELDAKTIDEDGDPLIGTLVEVTLPDLPQPARFCRVLCGTGREFAVGVPREVNTALEAQAWFQNKPLKEFTRPEIRT